MKVIVNINNNNNSTKEIKKFKVFDLGTITTDLASLIENKFIQIDEHTIPILKVTDEDDNVHSYIIQNIVKPEGSEEYIAEVSESDLLEIGSSGGSSEGFVPYTGATEDVNLGSNILSTEKGISGVFGTATFQLIEDEDNPGTWLFSFNSNGDGDSISTDVYALGNIRPYEGIIFQAGTTDISGGEIKINELGEININNTDALLKIKNMNSGLSKYYEIVADPEGEFIIGTDQYPVADGGLFRIDSYNRRVVLGDLAVNNNGTYIDIDDDSERINFRADGGMRLNGVLLTTAGTYNATTVTRTSAQLDATYPTATTGFKVYCPDIITGGPRIYEKYPLGWMVYSVTIP